MANINLYQSGQTGAQKIKTGTFDGGMIAAFIFALLTLGALAGVQFYLRSLDQKIAGLEEEKNRGYEELDENEVNAAASFQQRIEKVRAGAESFAADDPTRIFEAVQQNIIGGVVVSTMDFDGKTLLLTVNADSFDVLARQILSLKDSNFFRSVGVDSTIRGENGKIKAILSLGVANNKQ